MLWLFVSLTVVAVARTAEAQATAGFGDSGFFVQSADGNNRLTVGGILQFDGRFSPAFRLRTGKDKTPIGYEVLLGDTTLPFPERTLASALLPNRDVGVQAQGDLLGGRVSYSGGLFNGAVNGTSSTADVDVNNAKDLAGRIVVRGPGGLGFHLGGSTGTQSGAVPSFRTSVGQTFFSYAAGTTAGGTRTRVTPAVFYYFERFGGFAEYVRSAEQLTRPGATGDFVNQAWGVTASYSLTGEPVTDRGLRPAMTFDPAAGEWGALQLLARYSHLSVDAQAAAAGFAAAGSNREASSVTLALNWYPAPFVKWYATFERTTFDGDVSVERPAEHVILFRSQLNF